MKNIKTLMKASVLLTLIVLQLNCSSSSEINNPTPPIITNEMDFWLTKGDQSVKLQKQATELVFKTVNNAYQNIEVDETQNFQTIDGFGFTLTGGSAELINGLDAVKKQQLLQELFGTDVNSISISYLRISIGASDLNSSVFSYNDLPSGQSDISQTQFSLAPDFRTNRYIQIIDWNCYPETNRLDFNY